LLLYRQLGKHSQTRETPMDIMVWIGAAVSLIGLLGLFWCIFRVWRAKSAGMSDEDLRDLVKRTVPLNMAALMFSVLGLMAVMVGISLG
jgi:protein-S-isoprenylcysteine O-methyltransferase Ste14